MDNYKSYENWIKIRPYFRIVLQSLIIVFMIVGVVDTAMGGGGFMTANSLLFFTVQSNITIAAVCLVFCIIEIISLVKKTDFEIPKWLYTIKFLFTVAITLTFLVFWLILMPTMVAQGFGKYISTLSNIGCHTLVPIFAIVDWLVFDGKYRNKKYDFLYGVIMPIYYLIFSMICSTQNVDFGRGAKVPYFFLDYYANGWFTIGNGKLGVFWWIWIVVVIVIGISLLLMWGKNAVYKKLVVKEMRLPVKQVVTETVTEKNNEDN